MLIDKISKEEQRAWIVFGLAIVLVSYQAFAVVPLGTLFTLSQFFKHALAMSVMSFLLHRVLLARRAYSKERILLLILAGILTYGLFIEFVQSFLPWRSAEFIDIVADVFGIGLYLAGVILYDIFVRPARS